MKQWLRTQFRSFAQRAARIAGYSAMTWSLLGGSVSTGFSTSGMTVTRDSALKVAAYKRGVQLIADYIGKTPFLVKLDKANAKQHPAWRLTKKWARYHELSSFEFRRVITIHMLTTGNGYGWIQRDTQTARPVALHILDPGKVQPMLYAGRLVYRIAGSDTYLDATDVIHIRGFCVDGFSGLDPITRYATEVLGLAMAQQQYASKYYENGGTPQTYLRTDEFLDEAQWAKMQSQSGPLKRSMDNPHEIPVLEKADLKSVSMSAEQTQLLGAREFSLKDIANLLGMPAHKLGGSQATSYGSLEEENRSFRDDTLDPILVQFEIEYEKLLTEEEQQTESHSVEAVRESLERTNMSVRADVLYKAVGGPHMTQNEARDTVGLPSVKDGDKLLAPSNMVVVGQQPAAGPAGRSDDFDAQCLTALAAVTARMLTRLNTQIERTKSDGWRDFVNSLEEKHGDVIRSAFAPLIPLCGGDVKTLAGVTRSFFEVASRGSNAGVPIATPVDTLAGQILSIIRNRT